MIKHKTIIIKTFGNRKLKYYENLGYDISKDTIEVNIEHINKGSRIIVDVECDFCKKDVKVTYKEYLRNISIGDKYACSKYCGSLKAKETNIKNIGVESHMILGSVQEKVRKTNLEKYGVEYLQQSPYIRMKTYDTNIERYGVKHVLQNNQIKDRIKSDNILKYGVEEYMSSEDFKLKSKTTLFNNYGVSNPGKSDFIRERVKDTNIKKYGDVNYLLTSDFKDKSEKTLVNRYGVDNYSKSEDYKKNTKIGRDSNYLMYLDNYIKHIYVDDVISGYRDGLEIDIFLPKLKLGFEFNGLYWHSEKYKEKNYHLDKTNYFLEKGIRIIHIWEDDWIFRPEIIKSQISNTLGYSKRIYARKCFVKEVSVKDTRIFLNNNHIQGFTTSKLKLGLYFNDDLVGIMTFDKFEGRKKMTDTEWNLNRFCNKIGFNVIGGASKLLNYFIKNYNVSRIISYADRDWSSGNLYYILGFSNIGGNGPDYKYVVDNIRVHKSRYKKSKLNTSLTESQEMKKRNFLKIYDCGKIKFERKI